MDRVDCVSRRRLGQLHNGNWSGCTLYVLSSLNFDDVLPVVATGRGPRPSIDLLRPTLLRRSGRISKERTGL